MSPMIQSGAYECNGGQFDFSHRLSGRRLPTPEGDTTDEFRNRPSRRVLNTFVRAIASTTEPFSSRSQFTSANCVASGELPCKQPERSSTRCVYWSQQISLPPKKRGSSVI